MTADHVPDDMKGGAEKKRKVGANKARERYSPVTAFFALLLSAGGWANGRAAGRACADGCVLRLGCA